MAFWWRPPYSIRSLLVGQFLVVVVVAVSIVGAMMVAWRLPMVREQNQQQQARIADLVLQQLESSLDSAESVIRSVAPAAIQDMRNGHGSGGRATTDAMLQKLVISGDLYDGLYLLDPQLKIRAMGLALEYNQLANDWRGNDMAGLDVLDHARRRGELAWSDQYLSPVLGRPVVGLAMPVDGFSVLAEVSVHRLTEMALRAGRLEGLLVLVVDSKGEVVISPHMQDAVDRVNIRHLPLVQAALERRQVFDTLEYRGERYTGTALRVNRLGWGVVVAYPLAVAESSLRVALLITIVTIVVSLTIGLLMVGGLARLIGNRVDRTIGRARAIAAGDYLFERKASGIVEMQALDQALETMVLKIQRREQQLRALVDLTPNLAVQWFDAQGRILDWNPASETMFGWRRDEALGKTLDQLMYAPQEQQGFMDVLRRVARTGETFGPIESELRRRDGSHCYLFSTVFRIPGVEGEPIFVCMEIDVTRMKQQQDVILESEQKFNMFFNASPVAVSVRQQVGERYVYVAVNPAWESLMRFSSQQVVGQDSNGLGIHVNPQKMAGLAERIAAAGGTLRSESVVRRGDGSEIVGESVLALVHSGEVALVISSIHDVTEKRAMERDLRELNAELESRIQERTASLTAANIELRQAMLNLQQTQDRLVQSEKLASLGALVAGVSHELNTPIGNGLMAASTLQSRLKTFEKQYAQGLRRTDIEDFMTRVREGTEIALRNLERASSLIKGFKQVSVDQTSEHKRRFRVAELVEGILLTLHPMLKRTPYEVRLDMDTALEMDSYPGALGQVLTNLLQNAVAHGLDGLPAGHIDITARATGDDVVLQVRDNGHGIPPEVHKYLFDPFYTTKLGKGGSGLGLPIVRNIVTGVLQGHIEFDSVPGEGTVFRLILLRELPQAATSPGLSAA